MISSQGDIEFGCRLPVELNRIPHFFEPMFQVKPIETSRQGGRGSKTAIFG